MPQIKISKKINFRVLTKPMWGQPASWLSCSVSTSLQQITAENATHNSREGHASHFVRPMFPTTRTNSNTNHGEQKDQYLPKNMELTWSLRKRKNSIVVTIVIGDACLLIWGVGVWICLLLCTSISSYDSE